MQYGYPSNSHRNRDDVPEPRPKIESVITGNVVMKKPSFGKRIRETFIRGDARSAWTYVAYDIIVPAIKDVFLDGVEAGLNRFMYGDSRGGSRRNRYGRRDNPGHINYSGYSKSGNRYGRDEPRREMSKQARIAHDFDEVVLDTRAEAERVLERMTDLIDKYQVVTVSEFYDILGVTAGDFTDEKYGWYDLRNAQVDRVHGGYYLNLPKPEVLRD